MSVGKIPRAITKQKAYQIIKDKRYGRPYNVQIQLGCLKESKSC